MKPQAASQTRHESGAEEQSAEEEASDTEPGLGDAVEKAAFASMASGAGEEGWCMSTPEKHQTEARKCEKCRTITQHQRQLVLGGVEIWRCLVRGSNADRGVDPGGHAF